MPFLQYFNVHNIRKNSLRYFDQTRITQLKGGDDTYDTGASFFEDIVTNKLKYETINTGQFIRHLAGGSWKDVDRKSFITEGTKFLGR